MIVEVHTPLGEDVVDDVIARHPNRTGDLLAILEDLQRLHPQRYLPLPTLRLVASRMALSPSRVYSVATFYSFFNLEPQGKHTVMVCRGTACHTRGSKALLDRLKRTLNLIPSGDGETFRTPDRTLTVRTVACFGQCALAPVVEIDRDIYGRMNERELQKAIDQLSQEASQA